MSVRFRTGHGAQTWRTVSESDTTEKAEKKGIKRSAVVLERLMPEFTLFRRFFATKTSIKCDQKVVFFAHSK